MRPIGIVLLIWCTACASGTLRESDVNQPVGGLPGSVDLKLEHAARVGVLQGLEESCSSKTISDVRLRITAQSKPVAYHTFCDPKSRTVTLMGRDFVGPGTVQLSLERKGSASRFVGKPEIVVEFQNADFASDEDQVPGAAAVLSENQTIKGTVNYNAGDQTDWIRVEGEQGSMNVSVLSSAKNPPEAHLFVMDAESEQPISLGPFRLGHERRLVLSGRQVFVRVRAKRAPGETPYLVVRRDVLKGASQLVDVIDVYPVSEKSSVVVLEGREDLKEGSQVSILGLNSGGKAESLGRCVIKSAGKEQASCLIDRLPKPTMVSFKARYSKGG